MTPRLLAVSIALFCTGVSIPVALALTTAQATWIDDEERSCMADAVDRELEGRIAAYRDYHDQYIRDLEEYRADLASAWQISDKDDRRDALRDAVRANRDQSRQTKRTLDDRLRDVKVELRDAQRECRDRRNDHKKFVKDLCLSTSDCARNRICTTEQGECLPSCPPDAELCPQVCAGRCVRVTSSASSRFSSGFASSRSSTGFSAGMSSSRSSTSNVPGTNCTPYQCPDGREFPACDSNGNPVSYEQNPCYT